MKHCLSPFKDGSGAQRHSQGRKMCLWQIPYLKTMKIHSTGSLPFTYYSQNRLDHTIGFQSNYTSWSFQPVHILRLHSRKHGLYGKLHLPQKPRLARCCSPKYLCLTVLTFKCKGYLSCNYCSCNSKHQVLLLECRNRTNQPKLLLMKYAKSSQHCDGAELLGFSCEIWEKKGSCLSLLSWQPRRGKWSFHTGYETVFLS